MEWSKLLNYKSFNVSGQERNHPFDLSRTPFQIDYDRIIFSDEFRRLDKKTQVHPLKTNDHVHARLSHSLETSCVGRSLGCQVGKFLTSKPDFLPYPEVISQKVNSDVIMPILTGQIIQAACLAHDIGNPPFGHAGEELIQDWFKERAGENMFSELTKDEMDDLQSFEGNAQAFRVLTRTSMRVNEGGMSISYAVLGTMMKYPWIYSDKLPKKKFCSFISEKDYLQKVAEKCGLISSDLSEDRYSFSRHPFAFLSEASDDICYNIMDLEDAYELKILDYDTVFDIFSDLCSLKKDFDREKYRNKDDKGSLSYLRAVAIGQCVNSVVNEFENEYDNIMKGHKDLSYSLVKNSSISEIINNAKEISQTRVFISERKALLEVAANKALTTLLENFCEAVYNLHKLGKDKVSSYDRKILYLMGRNEPKESDTLFHKYQKVVDHISGMTDNYAIRISKNLNGVVE